MEAALTAKSQANAMDAGSEDDFDSDVYYDNLDVWNGFIDQAASSDASDKSSVKSK